MPSDVEPDPRVRWWAVVGLLLIAAGVAALTLLPIGWGLNRFVVWLYYDGLHLYAWPLVSQLSLEGLALVLNVLLMVPVGLLGRIAFPRVPWWAVGCAVLLASATVEAAQLWLPLGREASVADVVSNAAGGFLGAGLVEWLGRRRRRPASGGEPGQPGDPLDGR